jgi:hypothetical protein
VKYTIAPIETRYGGVVFRSRLEAKWAVMFDLLGWNWTYEPLDFSGWIPDFGLECLEGATVYVEVKPVSVFPADTAMKIDQSGCKSEVLIVGQECPLRGNACTCIGWLREDDRWFGKEVWDECYFTEDQFGYDFCHSTGSYISRIRGFYDGDYHICKTDKQKESVRMIWREAGNKVRWNPCPHGVVGK